MSKLRQIVRRHLHKLRLAVARPYSGSVGIIIMLCISGFLYVTSRLSIIGQEKATLVSVQFIRMSILSTEFSSVAPYSFVSQFSQPGSRRGGLFCRRFVFVIYLF